MLLRGVGTLPCFFSPPNASVQWQPDGLTIHTKKWFPGAGFLGAPPISLDLSVSGRDGREPMLERAVKAMRQMGRMRTFVLAFHPRVHAHAKVVSTRGHTSARMQECSLPLRHMCVQLAFTPTIHRTSTCVPTGLGDSFHSGTLLHTSKQPLDD